MRMLFKVVGILTIIFFIVSCTTSNQRNPLPGSTQRVVNKAENSGFKLVIYKSSPFSLTTYEKSLPESQNPVVHVYIEGDGNSWKTKYQISNNPTPYQPLALRLALLDQHPDVIYLARPCQYTPMDLNPECSPKFWSSHRYSEEVIQAISNVLDKIKAKKHNSQFLLIGFSGGASVAALLAQQREDINGLITVAGDLNHEQLNQHHGTTPLKGSLNPIQKAHTLRNLPQEHWVGARDKIVPTWIAEQFVKKVNNPDCAKVHVVKNATHHKGWEERWEEVLGEFAEAAKKCSSKNEEKN